jgi:hypothetical protein
MEEYSIQLIKSLFWHAMPQDLEELWAVDWPTELHSSMVNFHARQSTWKNCTSVA